MFSVCIPIAPEDIDPGTYIMPLSERHEFVHPSPFSPCEASMPLRIAKLTMLPSMTPAPWKVVGVCLPFVLVQNVDKSYELLDTRRLTLAQVNEEFAHRCIKHMRNSQKASDRNED